MYAAMSNANDNWRTQIRKGYLELCILSLIRVRKRIYGFDLICELETRGLEVKEGTLYPLLNRMTSDGCLSAAWETDNLKGHPRKFYSLTRDGQRALGEMGSEFESMIQVYRKLVQ